MAIMSIEGLSIKSCFASAVVVARTFAISLRRRRRRLIRNSAIEIDQFEWKMEYGIYYMIALCSSSNSGGNSSSPCVCFNEDLLVAPNHRQSFTFIAGVVVSAAVGIYLSG